MKLTPNSRLNQDPETLKPFPFFGVDLPCDSGSEAVGTCPLCGKEDHLYVNPKTGQWDCKSCGSNGNIPSFLKRLWEASLAQTTDDDFQELSEDRGIPTDVLRDWGLAQSIINNEWLIPVGITPKGLANLHPYREIKGRMKTPSSPTCKLGLPGAGSGHKMLPTICMDREVRLVLDHDQTATVFPPPSDPGMY